MKLLIADLDGTLVEVWQTTPLPGIPERLERLRAQGIPIAVVTNQGGVGYRYAHEQRGEWTQARRYPTLAEVVSRLEAIAEQLPINRMYACLHHGRADWPIPPLYYEFCDVLETVGSLSCFKTPFLEGPPGSSDWMPCPPLGHQARVVDFCSSRSPSMEDRTVSSARLAGSLHSQG